MANRNALRFIVEIIMKTCTLKTSLLSALLFIFLHAGFAQTSWTGTSDEEWRNADNWTAGVPDASTDAIIGDANFTGAFQPNLKRSGGVGNCNNLTIGNDTKTCVLTSDDELNIHGTLTIGSNGTLYHNRSYIYITGDFVNNGTYTADDSNRRVYMVGTNNSLGGSSTTTFAKLYVNAGSTVTLTGDIIVDQRLDLRGTFDPTENYTVNGTGNHIIRGTGTLVVKASTYAGNYPFSGSLTLRNNSTIDYASSAINQSVNSTINYRNLKISGGLVKSLTGNTSVRGNLEIDAGTLDIETYTINRNSSGGFLSLAGGAFLKIGGTQSFPSNYATHIIATTSTVNYYGGDQVVTNETYGNLILSSSSGAVVKTMPATALTIAGDLTSSASVGTLSFTAGNNILVLGDITLGSNTTFDGATYSHEVSGDVINSGIYSGASSTYTSNGGNASWSGAGTYNMGDIVINGANTTFDQNSSFSIAGNFSTATSGTITHTTGGTGVVTMTGTSKTISGQGIILDDLTIATLATISNSSSFEVAGDLIVVGNLTDSGQKITLSGTGKTITASGTLQFYELAVSGSITTASSFSISSNLNVTGSFSASAGTITFNGTSDLAGTASLFNVTVDNASTLKMGVNSTLNISGTDALVGTGTFDGTTNSPNTVGYNSSSAQTINFNDFHHLTVSNGNVKTPATGLTVNGDLTIGSSTSLAGSSFTHTVKGDWINNGTFTPGTSSIQLTGDENTSISGNNTFNILTLNKGANNTITLDDNVSTATLNMTSGLMQTGANKITITSTRTGNGIIIGTITRQHLFIAGTNYAFEGPNNFINFTSITGVISSITVEVDNTTLSTFPYRESINRSYDVTISGTVISYIASLRLHYETVDLNGNDESTMTLWNDQGTTTWIEIGSNSNSTADNWVEKTGLTSLENKWSLSDGLKVFSWTGAISSSTSNPGNWTITAGSPGSSLDSDDVVVFGDQPFVNQPAFDASTTIKRIIFESTQAATVTISPGTTMTVMGNILGDWSGGNATHTINVGSESLIVNGDIELSDGTPGHAIDLNASTGSVTVVGGLFQEGGADITFTGAATLAIGEDFNYTSGTFTAGNSTVTYDGTMNQVVGGVSYNHLTFDNSTGIIISGGNIQVAGNLNLNNGTFTQEHDLNIEGDLSIGTGTTLNAGDGNSLNVAGNTTIDGTFNSGTSNFIVDGTGSQNIASGTYHDITINKASGTATLDGDLLIKGNATISGGTLDAGTHFITRTSAGGSATIAAGTTAIFGGGSTQVQNFASFVIDPTSTVHFNGTVARVIPPFAYGNLIISNGAANAKSLLGTTSVLGDLTINSGSTFSIANQILILEGDLNIIGTFTTTNSFLELNGTNKEISGSTDYNDVFVNGSYDYISGNPNFNGNIEIGSAGDFDLGSATVNVYGDFTNRGITQSNGTVTFMGTQVQTIRLLNAITSSSSGVINFNGTVAPVLNSTSSPQFATVNINNTAPIAPSAPWTVAVNMTIASGATFSAGSLTHNFLGFFVNNGTVTSVGSMNFTPINFASTIALGDFTSTGSVTLGGTQAITLSDNTPNFNSVTISNSHASGVTAGSAWTVADNLLITSGATFNAGSYTHTISGDFSNQGTLDGQTSTFIFDGASGSDGISGAGTTVFNHLTFDVGSIMEIVTSIGVTGDFAINGTSLDLTNASVEFSGASLSVLSGASPTFNDLTINKSAGNVRLDVDASISNSLTLTNGLLLLNGNELSVTNPLASAIDRTSGLIVSESTDNSSKINWSIGTNLDQHIFPFGTVSSEYIPFSFDLNSGDAGIVSVSTYPTGSDNLPFPSGVLNIDASNINNSKHTVDRFFQIDLAGETTPSVDIEFTATATEIGTISGLMAQRWNGTIWEPPLPGQTNTATSVAVPNVTQFSPWAISGNEMALPVELVDFSARIKDKKVTLIWSTATEINNEGFIIQRSVDGKSFDDIGYVKGHEDSDELLSYSFKDYAPPSGLIYYRLKQVDFDGAFEFSRIEVAEIAKEFNESFSIFPNPIQGTSIELKTEGIQNEEISLSLMSIDGKIIWNKQLLVPYEGSILHLPLNQKFNRGTYLMLCETRSGVSQIKVIIED